MSCIRLSLVPIDMELIRPRQFGMKSASRHYVMGLLCRAAGVSRVGGVGVGGSQSELMKFSIYESM